MTQNVNTDEKGHREVTTEPGDLFSLRLWNYIVQPKTIQIPPLEQIKMVQGTQTDPDTGMHLECLVPEPVIEAARMVRVWMNQFCSGKREQWELEGLRRADIPPVELSPSEMKNEDYYTEGYSNGYVKGYNAAMAAVKELKTP